MECATPSTSPIAKTGMGFLSRLIRMDMPEDPKRMAVVVSTVVLGLGFMTLVIPAGVRIYKAGDLGAGAVAAIVSIGITLGGLAGYTHGKGDEITPVPEGQDATKN